MEQHAVSDADRVAGSIAWSGKVGREGGQGLIACAQGIPFFAAR